MQIRDAGISVLDVLELIARGFTYERILHTFKELTYDDLFQAAKSARQFIERRLGASRLERIRQKHPRAYESWTKEEEARLADECLHKRRTIPEVAEILQRQPSAIRSRLQKMDLLGTNMMGTGELSQP